MIEHLCNKRPQRYLSLCSGLCPSQVATRVAFRERLELDSTRAGKLERLEPVSLRVASPFHVELRRSTEYFF